VTVADTREARTRIALAATGWAYLAAVARNDALRSTEALKAFQTLFTANRQYVTSGFSDVAAADRALPFLAIDGRLGPNTRNALSGAIYVAHYAYFGGPADYNAAPAVALLEGDPAAFYRANTALAATMGGASFDAAVRDLPVSGVYSALITQANAAITGSAPEIVPGGSVPDTTRPRTDITDALDISTPRSRFVMPTWGWWAIGIGLATATGIVGWGLWTKYRRKKAGSK